MYRRRSMRRWFLAGCVAVFAATAFAEVSVQRLKELKAALDAGLISSEEYNQAKADFLGQGTTNKTASSGSESSASGQTSAVAPASWFSGWWRVRTEYQQTEDSILSSFLTDSHPVKTYWEVFHTADGLKIVEHTIPDGIGNYSRTDSSGFIIDDSRAVQGSEQSPLAISRYKVDGSNVRIETTISSEGDKVVSDYQLKRIGAGELQGDCSYEQTFYNPYGGGKMRRVGSGHISLFRTEKPAELTASDEW